MLVSLVIMVLNIKHSRKTLGLSNATLSVQDKEHNLYSIVKYNNIK